MSALTERRRPRAFDDVLGQDWIVAFLREQARVSKNEPEIGGRHVFLHGAPGLGKTSLAELYAQALHCQMGEDDPCGRADCPDCGEYLRSGAHQNLVRISPDENALENFRDALTRHETSAWLGGGWLVIIVDQAHRLSAAALDALHDRVERSPTKVTVIFLSTAADEIPARARELFVQFELRALILTDRMKLLGRTCADEGWTAEAGALEILARRAGGRPRALLNAVEAIVGTKGGLSVEDVHAFYRVGGEDAIYDYLRRVLARENLDGQWSALAAWEVDPLTKARGVKKILGDLVGQRFFGVLPLDPARGETASMILDGLIGRAVGLKLNARELIGWVSEVWREPFGEEELDLLARVNAFDQLMNGAGGTELSVSKGIVVRRPRTVATAAGRVQLKPTGTARMKAPAGKGRGVRSAPIRPEFLSFEQVRRIWDAGSFLIQKYGVYLNTLMVIRFDPLGFTSERDAIEFVTSFSHEMKMRVQRRKKDAGLFQYICVNERDEAGKMVASLAASLPGAGQADFRQWLFDDFLPRHAPSGFSKEGVSWEMKGKKQEQGIIEHVRLLRLLCRGLDPGIEVEALDDEERVVAQSLLEIIGVVDARPSGPTFSRKRFTTSEGIGPKAMKEASAVLPPLSAFDTNRWSCLESDWERAEHAYRRQKEKERAAALSELMKAFGQDPVEILQRDRAIADFEEKWTKAAAAREAERPGIKEEKKPFLE